MPGFDPVTAVLDVIGKIIDRVFPDPSQAANAKLEMFKLQQEGQFKLMDQDFQLTLEQVKVNAVEAASGSTFVSGARPAAMWVCVFGLFYTFIAQPFLAWGSLIFKIPVPPVIDTSMLIQLLIATLGLAGWRSLDKLNGVASK
jgi:hypothetical protein